MNALLLNNEQRVLSKNMFEFENVTYYILKFYSRYIYIAIKTKNGFQLIEHILAKAN